MKRYRIMFVCHGNICRSPSAEFIMKKLVRDKGVSDWFEIFSSATSNEEIFGGTGNPVYPPMKLELEKHGIDCSGKRAEKLRKDDYEKYDLFIGMDSANIRNMHRIFSCDPDGKIKKLLDFTSSGGDVADPWYSERFDTAYNDILKGCKALLDVLLKN